MALDEMKPYLRLSTKADAGSHLELSAMIRGHREWIGQQVVSLQ